MKIRYFASLREITRQNEQTWNQPVTRLGDLLVSLCNLYGPNFRRWVLTQENGLGQLAIVLINGHDCRELGGLETELLPEDVISIFPPVAGG